MWVRYKDRNADSDSEAADTGLMKIQGKSSKKKKKSKKPKKAKSKGGKKAKAPPKEATVKYEAGKMKEVRAKFLKSARENGCTYRDACKLWNESPERWDLLKGLSRSELVRRKFIPAANPRPRAKK